MADAATDARAALDRVETSLRPGHGRVDLFAAVRSSMLGGVPSGVALAGLEVAHRFSPGWSVFGRGSMGVAWAGGDRRLEAEALIGLRGAW